MARIWQVPNVGTSMRRAVRELARRLIPYRLIFALPSALLTHVLRAAESPRSQPTDSRRGAVEAVPVSLESELGPYFALVMRDDKCMNFTDLNKVPINDAEAVEEILREDYGFEVGLIPDGTRHQILGALEDYGNLPYDSNLLVYYAGHGGETELQTEWRCLWGKAPSVSPLRFIVKNFIANVSSHMSPLSTLLKHPKLSGSNRACSIVAKIKFQSRVIHPS